MKTKFNTAFAILLALVLTVTSFGSASAKPQPASMAADYKCNFSPLKPTGYAPAKIVFTADYNGSDVDSYLWTFGDGNSASGAVVENTFSGQVSNPHIKLQVWLHDGTSIQCSTWGNIMEPVQTVVSVTPTPNAYGNSNSGAAANMGNDNFAPVINGNNNQININPDPVVIIITPSPTPSATATPVPAVTPVVPVPDDNSCSGYCASNGGTININPTPAQNSPAVKTMPTNFLAMLIYSIIDGFTSPGENWKTWFVENY